MGKVTIEVYGGIAEVTSNPDNIEVEILDWDNFKEWGTLSGEMCLGCYSNETRWGNDTFPYCIRHYNEYEDNS